MTLISLEEAKTYLRVDSADEDAVIGSLLSADGIAYLKVSAVHIELYTDRKDPETEALLESVLDAHGVFYDKSEVWIGSEKLYEVLYSFERKAE